MSNTFFDSVVLFLMNSLLILTELISVVIITTAWNELSDSIKHRFKYYLELMF